MNRIAPASQKVHLRLYTGQKTFESRAAVSQVQSLIGSLPGSFEIEVLDTAEYRDQAADDQVMFTPLLVRISPEPVVRVSMPQANSAALREAVLG